jgi:hypothetical protein
MKRMARIALTLLIAGSGLAQGRGYFRGGFGPRVGFRGPGLHHRGFGFRASPFAFRHRAFGFRSVYPFLVGSYYVPYSPFLSSYSDLYPYPTGPAVSVVYPPAQAVAPIVITQYIPRREPPSVVREYRSDQSVELESKPALYLIAFKDGVIRASVAYWIDKDSLHYITRNREHRQASLDSVDREFTLRLNRERGVAFSFAPVN